MALRNIVYLGSETLKKECKPVTVFDKNLAILLDDMYETMIKNQGSGLAGPQVGILKQVIVVEYNGIKLEMVNPKITFSEGSETEIEGCLSVKNIRGYVERPKKITVTGFDRSGNPYTLTCCEWLARVFCHEIDHLHGIVFVDKMISEYNPNKKVGK